MKVVFSKNGIEEKWAGSGFRALDVTARVKLEEHYKKYPHLIPPHLRNHFNALRAKEQETQAGKKEEPCR